MNTIFNYIFILISTFYVYHKLLHTPPFTKKQIVYSAAACIIASLVTYIFSLTYPFLCLPVLFILFVIGMTINSSAHFSLIFSCTIISFGISYIAFEIACFFSTLIIIFTSSYHKNLPFIFHLLNGFLQFLLVHIPFRFKRLKKGMPFLNSTAMNYIGLFLCIPVFFGIFIFQILDSKISFINNIAFFIVFFSILFCGLLLLFWWRSRLTRSYLDRLQRTELESLRNQVDEKEQEIARLIDNNDALARIIHKDNKLIPAMELAVRDFLTDYKTLDSIQIEKKGQALLSSLSEMAQNRTGILHDYQSSDRETSSTGCCSIDAILSLMKNRALTAHIDFSVSLHADMSAFDSLGVSEEDLTHLLADLLDNALIAMREQPSGHLLVYFGYMKDAFVLEVSDSGTAFAPEVFQSFGLEKHSMHEDTGGSGIGLMDIWAIKKKYRCSLHIIEYPAFPATSSIPNYTKKLSFLFDHKNRYAIRTYRRKELQRTLLRNDLIVLSDS